MTLSVRSRLVLAFLLLSVLPLSAVTLISYRSSVRAFEQAAEREANERAADVTRRMEAVTADLGQRVDRMFVQAPQTTYRGRPAPDPLKLGATMAPILGETATLIEKVEFRPEAAPPAPPVSGPLPTAPAPPAPPAMPAPPAVPRPAAAAGPADPVIVVDVAAMMAEARRTTSEGLAHVDPKLAALIEQSMVLGAASAESGLNAAAAAIAKQVAAGARDRRVQMDVQGRDLQVSVHKDGRLLGKANATLNMDRTLRAVLALANRDQGELPFAIDRRGKLYSSNPDDLTMLRAMGVEQLAPRAVGGAPQRTGEWMVVARRDTSGITFGIARPIGRSLREIGRTSVRNLGLGLGVIALALIGIVPISHRMTQHLSALTAGVRQLAGGDFAARVPVRTQDEFGTLASAFNQMASDLERNQALVVEQERLRRELELSRQIQTEMLPRAPLRSDAAEIAGISIPAREVGGDFFNYFDLPNGGMALLVGDVSGKGVSAALLMANAQATLRARLPVDQDLARLADAFDRELEGNTPQSVYLTLFIGILEENGRRLRYVNAGHNPQFLVRARGPIVPLSSTGLPIALYAGHGYAERSIDVSPGDLLFFYTDGLVEAEDAAGEMFGAERLQALLAGAQSTELGAILRLIEERVSAFRGAVEPLDDATMMALRITERSSGRSPA